MDPATSECQFRRFRRVWPGEAAWLAWVRRSDTIRDAPGAGHRGRALWIELRENHWYGVD
ncbi:hypothetical protein FB566_4038 [Stackebrandtia endophytica]|uniref:Uncharacterized protein n=1 Tax=Stackebrandtia endophytica TaxID=1496996 RepID=A0A543B0Z5_9ACTN|nr:hypothetical protein FB566_4038 [Stackebrandtia endophytica]